MLYIHADMQFVFHLQISVKQQAWARNTRALCPEPPMAGPASGGTASLRMVTHSLTPPDSRMASFQTTTAGIRTESLEVRGVTQRIPTRDGSTAGSVSVTYAENQPVREETI